MNPLAFLPGLSAAATIAGAVAGEATRRVGQSVQSFAAALEAATAKVTHFDGGDTKPPPAESSASSAIDPTALYRRLVGPAASYVGEPVPLGKLEDSTRQILDHVRHELRRQLQGAGIDDIQDLQLQVRPGDGQIVVRGAPAGRAALEEILAREPGLADMLRQAAAMSELVRAGNENLRFSLDYEDDPLAALTRFGQLFDDAHRGTLTVTLDEFGTDAEFV